MKTLREKLKFADGKMLSELFKKKILDVLGPETEEDKKKKKEKMNMMKKD